MLIEIDRRVLEQFVKDKEFMYQLVNNWAAETSEHYSWYGVGLHYGRKHLVFRPRGATQISIKYENFDAECWDDSRHIEKRILKYKGKR
jgi:hypothetical protein